jgi:hypothetical protein
MITTFILLTTPILSELTWTQYSDRASLPKSKRERDRLRDLLSRVNEAYLNSPEDRQRYRDLKQIFDDDDDMVEYSPGRLSSSTVAVSVVVTVLAVLIVFNYKRPQLQNVVDEELRQARLKKFTLFVWIIT